MGIPTIGAKLPQLTLPGVNALLIALLILGSISQLARGCHQQPVEVGVSNSVNCGVPHRI